LYIESDRIGDGEYQSEQIDEFISEHFAGQDFAAKKLEKVDARLERFLNEKSWYSEYEISRCVNERLRLMEELGHPNDEIEAFRKTYRHLPVIREMEMQELEDAGKLSELIVLLEESKAIDKGSPGLVSKYSHRLVKCYDDDGYFYKATEELFKYLTEYSRGDREAFVELRARTDEERWLHKREEIFRVLLEKSVDIKPLLAEEKLNERLFDLLTVEIYKAKGFEKINIHKICKYESLLRPEFDEQLLDLYENMICKISEFAGGRSHYKELAGFIRKMHPYPGGKERAIKMLDAWRFTYSNRPAMQDELRVLYSE
jgi:hypothetical protein